MKTKCGECKKDDRPVYFRCVNCGGVLCGDCVPETRQCDVCASGGLMERMQVSR